MTARRRKRACQRNLYVTRTQRAHRAVVFACVRACDRNAKHSNVALLAFPNRILNSAIMPIDQVNNARVPCVCVNV